MRIQRIRELIDAGELDAELRRPRARISSRDTPLERMPVVILAGGLGTRMREETERVPKPLVAIGERPILWHIMKLYAHHGAQRFVLCLGFKSWQIKEYFLRYREQIADLTVASASPRRPFSTATARRTGRSRSPRPGCNAGTGARLHRVRDYVDTDTFVVTYGDGLGSVDIGALLAFHREHGRIGTVTGVHPTSRYGEMKVTDGIVTEFDEKPTTAEGFVSGGFFVFQRELFDYLTDDPGARPRARAAEPPRARRAARRLPPHGLLDGDGHHARVRRAQPAVGGGGCAVEGLGGLALPVPPAKVNGRLQLEPVEAELRTRELATRLLQHRLMPPERVEVDEHEPLDARVAGHHARVAAGGVDLGPPGGPR